MGQQYKADRGRCLPCFECQFKTLYVHLPGTVPMKMSANCLREKPESLEMRATTFTKRWIKKRTYDIALAAFRNGLHVSRKEVPIVCTEPPTMIEEVSGRWARQELGGESTTRSPGWGVDGDTNLRRKISVEKDPKSFRKIESFSSSFSDSDKIREGHCTGSQPHSLFETPVSQQQHNTLAQLFLLSLLSSTLPPSSLNTVS